MRFVRYLVALALIAPAGLRGAPDTPQKIVAVLELRNMLPAQERATVNLTYFSDAVRTTTLEMAPGLQVMTRENVIVLLESAGKKLSECEGECEVDTGRRLGADFVISGELYRLGPSLRLNLRLHDTHSGSLLAGAQAEGSEATELDKAMRPACEKLLARFKGQAAPPAAGALTSPMHLWTENEGAYSVRLSGLNGSFACPTPVTTVQPCDVGGLQPGFLRVSVEGDAAFTTDFTLKPGGGNFEVRRRGYALLGVGLGSLIAGGLGMGIGLALPKINHVNCVGGCSEPDPATPPLFLGGATLVLAGLTVLIVDLAKGGHSWEVLEREPPSPPPSEATLAAEAASTRSTPSSLASAAIGSTGPTTSGIGEGTLFVHGREPAACVVKWSGQGAAEEKPLVPDAPLIFKSNSSLFTLRCRREGRAVFEKNGKLGAGEVRDVEVHFTPQ